MRSPLGSMRVTLVSPNPFPYVIYGVSGGMYGQTVACGGNYIFVHGEGNFYVYARGTEAVSEIDSAGKVYCYNPNGELVTTLSTQNPTLYGFFGSSLAANEDYVIVGARGESVDVTNGDETTTIPYAGHVYIFTANGTCVKTLTSLNPQVYGLFGISVAFGSGYYVIGAPEENATMRYRSTIQTYNRAGVTYILN